MNPLSSFEPLIIGETGTVNSFDHQGSTIFLHHTYHNPVVFAQSLSYNGHDPAIVRIQDVQNDHFTAFLQEPSYLKDGWHVPESFSYFVFEAGRWGLDNGVQLEVGTLDTHYLATEGWETVNFSNNFDSDPIIFSQVQTFNDPAFVRTRQRNVKPENFQLTMEEEEQAQYSGHATETIGWLAISQGLGEWNAHPDQEFSTNDEIQHGWATVDFQTEFSIPPAFMASIATYNGSDPAGLRYRHLEKTTVQIKIEEDQSADNETYHTTEVVNFFAIAAGGILTALPLGFDQILESETDASIYFPEDSGVVDVTRYGAVPDDHIDDTQAIQTALDNNASLNRIIYFPDGTYDISAQLNFSGSQKRTIIQGQSRSGTILRLKDNLGFDGSVLWTGAPPAQRFRNSIRNLTVNIGIGNPEAIAITFMANNQGVLRGVNILSEDGQGAIGLNLAPDENGPLLVKDVYINGFDVGIRTFNPTATQTFERIRLKNQNQYGWQNFNQTIFVRDLQSINAIPVIWNMPDSQGNVTLIDAHLIGTVGADDVPAIWNQKRMYVRNLITAGYALAILQDDKGRGRPSQPDGFIEEWIARGEFDNVFESPSTALSLSIVETPVIPWDSLEGWASPLAFGGVPNDGIDDTAAIQAAIDSGASTIYLPNGIWNLTETVTIRSNVQRLVGTETFIRGGGQIRVESGSASIVLIERLDAGNISLVHDSNRTLVLSSMILNDYRNTSRGVGDLFIEDVSGGPWEFYDQNVWARQINPETGANPRILNDGGNLWILGYKTEDEGTLIETVNGGHTELLGGYILNGEFGDIPAFINQESSLSYVSVIFQTFSSGSIPIGVQETRGGVTKITSGLPAYYAGYRSETYRN
jgi:hypothetical protein